MQYSCLSSLLLLVHNLETSPLRLLRRLRLRLNHIGNRWLLARCGIALPRSGVGLTLADKLLSESSAIEGRAASVYRLGNDFHGDGVDLEREGQEHAHDFFL